MTRSEDKITTLGTVSKFFKLGSCSEALCNVVNSAFNNHLPDEEHATMPLAGGIVQHGYQCGLIWGAALSAGAQAYRLFGPTPKAQAGAVIAAQRIIESFRKRNRHIDCLELIETDWHRKMQIFEYFIRGGMFGCIYMTVRFAPVAVRAIGEALSSGDMPEIPEPVSCTAMLAKKTGLPESHVIMVSGFAGGIGLSGSACGALAAAIWILSLRTIEKGTGDLDYKDPRAHEVVDKFLKCSGFEFECSKIAGRIFSDVNDHSCYLKEGGCQKIIDALADSIK